MDFRIYFKHMPSSLSTYAYAEKKLGERLDKYHLNVVEAHLTFSMENGLCKVASHIVAAGGVNITLEGEDGFNMMAAIDKLADRIDAYLRKRKEKLRTHRPRASLASLSFITPPPEDAIDASEVLRFEKAHAHSPQ